MTDATASAALNKHVALLLPPGGIEAKLAQAQGRPLVVKLGFDPTSPDLHLGHAVVLRKLRDFVDAGHKVRIIIGDFTAAIGDPTGRNNARPPLSQDQISQNAQTYMAQVYKILPVDKVSFHRNSEWLGAMTPYDIIKMTSQVTVSRILSRDDFKDRIKTNVPIQMHEILYPLFQGWDSVAIEADIEIGGTDQLFNCSMGRDLQSAAGQPEQVVLTMPLLVGLDGVDKMSKSNGNYIALNDPPEVMYRKCMSIPDSAMHDYMRLACDFDDDAISNYASGLKDSSHHPMTIKKMIAGNIVTIYHGLSAAEDAAEHFRRNVQERSGNEKDHILVDLSEIDIRDINLLNLCAKLIPEDSRTAMRRLIHDGSVKLDGVKVLDSNAIVGFLGDNLIVSIGKHRSFKVTRKREPVLSSVKTTNSP